ATPPTAPALPQSGPAHARTATAPRPAASPPHRALALPPTPAPHAGYRAPAPAAPARAPGPARPVPARLAPPAARRSPGAGFAPLPLLLLPAAGPARTGAPSPAADSALRWLAPRRGPG